MLISDNAVEGSGPLYELAKILASYALGDTTPVVLMLANGNEVGNVGAPAEVYIVKAICASGMPGVTSLVLPFGPGFASIQPATLEASGGVMIFTHYQATEDTMLIGYKVQLKTDV
ncbi:hypothetical protein Q5H93_03000 [Hymenobacter sp. ASUV-10]|uniref:Uncharacterized protein n=1 Tax=Hymenobacter aranciens TaxID=3063996 RepID=A0ABT9B9H3_9BACT|nr:hypothetical protein [Hymenobacter sp. ASUV-10]MDO7873687.1 hypothetical protein [Hymenobacter sp. ASUV-10]